MSTNQGDLVLGPFSGSGTTFAVCEGWKRRWIGVKIYSVEEISERLKEQSAADHRNRDYIERGRCEHDEPIAAE